VWNTEHLLRRLPNRCYQTFSRYFDAPSSVPERVRRKLCTTDFLLGLQRVSSGKWRGHNYLKDQQRLISKRRNCNRSGLSDHCMRQSYINDRGKTSEKSCLALSSCYLNNQDFITTDVQSVDEISAGLDPSLLRFQNENEVYQRDIRIA